jgi:hypothetical protein
MILLIDKLNSQEAGPGRRKRRAGEAGRAVFKYIQAPADPRGGSREAREAGQEGWPRRV